MTYARVRIAGTDGRVSRSSPACAGGSTTSCVDGKRVTLVVVEGPAFAGVESTAQALAHEIGARHLALYDGSWQQLTYEGHILADEIAIQIALGLEVDVVFERSLPTTWVCARASEADFDQFKVMYLDNVIASNEHLGVFLRPKDFEAWIELAGGPPHPNVEVGHNIYSKFDKFYMDYVKGSRMRWLIMDPFPPIEKIIRHLKREEEEE